MKKNIDNIIIIALVIIIVLQLGLRIYLGNMKQYFHVDEIASYGLMHYKRSFIVDNIDFNNRWHTKDYFLKYLDVEEEKMLNLSQIYKNQVNDQHPPVYYILLNCMASILGGRFNKWSGIIINIFIFIWSNILVFLISNKIFKNKWYSVIACTMYGFSLLALQTTMFIRMYELATFNLLLFTYCNYCIMEKEKVPISLWIILGMSAILGILTHYYYVIFASIVYLLLIIKLIINKDRVKIIKYFSVVGIAYIISYLLFPAMKNHIFTHYIGRQTTKNFFSSIINIEKIKEYIKILDSQIFANGLKLLLIIIILLILYCIMKKYRNKELKIIKKCKNENIYLIIIPSIIYFFIVTKISPYVEERYIMQICPFINIIAVYILGKILNNITKKKSSTIILASICIIITIVNIINSSNIEYVYKDTKEYMEKIENKKELPGIYIYSSDNDFRMFNLYTFSKIERMYIIKEEYITTNKFKEILKNIETSNGILVFCDRNTKKQQCINKLISTNIVNNCENYCSYCDLDIYLIY